jgi:hypothetical protein
MTAERAVAELIRQHIAHANQVADVWLFYMAALPDEMDEAERRVIARAFYTGASCAASLVLKAIALDDETEMRARMDALYQEFRRFAGDVEAGRA